MRLEYLSTENEYYTHHLVERIQNNYKLDDIDSKSGFIKKSYKYKNNLEDKIFINEDKFNNGIDKIKLINDKFQIVCDSFKNIFFVQEMPNHIIEIIKSNID